MIGVQSYPELFTTLIGWQQYNNLWWLMSQSGLVFVPFIMIIINNTVTPMRSQYGKEASTTSLQRMEMDLVGMLLVISIAAQPLITIDPQVLEFTPACYDATLANAAQSNTSYDKAFPQAKAVRVPLFWYAVMSISQGLTSAAMKGIECQPNLRKLKLVLDTNRIEDPKLRQSVQQFFQQCYVPTFDKYLRGGYQTDIFGEPESQWLGSSLFINTSGFYDSFFAHQVIPGFAFEPKRDFENSNNSQRWGRPSCKMWWLDDAKGLYAQLRQNIPREFLDYFRGGVAEENAIRSLIQNSFSSVEPGFGEQMWSGKNWLSKIGSNIGLSLEKFSFYPKMYLIVQILPIIQACILMACYCLLPIFMLVACFRPSLLFSFAFAIFSIIFWAFLWHLAEFVDQALIKALYPENILGGKSAEQDLVDMVASLMYIGLPILWSVVMGYAGSRMGHGIMSLIQHGSSPAQGAGEKTGSITTGVATGGIGKLR